MLTKKLNLLETIRGGNPDRYVLDFEPFMRQWYTPQDIRHPDPIEGGPDAKDCWGVTWTYPQDSIGPFPLADEEHLVLKDITHWRDYVKMPETDFPEEEWQPLVAEAETVDRNEYFVTACFFAGLFERTHHLMGMEECMINLYEEPEHMHDLIDYLMQYELKMAQQICKHYKPTALWRQDDWGSQRSTFMSNDMFREFYFEPTRKIYQYYKDHGVEIILHHSNAFGETMMEEMIETGVDIWQGVVLSNNIPKIIAEYGEKITIMGGLDNGVIDHPNWKKEDLEAEVDKICKWAGTKYFIPGFTSATNYPEVGEIVLERVDQLSKVMF